MSDYKKIAIENASILVDNIILRAVQCLNSGKSVEGIGCLMKKSFEIIPLLYEEENGLSITVQSFKRLYEALKEEVTTNRAIATGIANEGNVYLDDAKYNAIIINLFHELIKDEVITYVMPYMIIKTSEAKGSEIILLEDSAHLEFNPMN